MGTFRSRQGKFEYFMENTVRCNRCGHGAGGDDPMGMVGNPCPCCTVDDDDVRFPSALEPTPADPHVYDMVDVVAAFEAGLHVGRGE